MKTTAFGVCLPELELMNVCVGVRKQGRRKERKEGRMANVLKSVKVAPNSANLDEARRRVFDFFKTACRSIPTIMQVYNLSDIVSPSQLRSTVASQIRHNSHISNPKVTFVKIVPFCCL